MVTCSPDIARTSTTGWICFVSRALKVLCPCTFNAAIASHTSSYDNIVFMKRQVRCIVCALFCSVMGLAFTSMERGVSYSTLAQFSGILLYAPILLDAYGALLGESLLAYMLFFPVNVWLLEVVLGYGITWLHGHNVAWCYADYADTFFNGYCRLGLAPAWAVLGWLCFYTYPWLVNATLVLN